MKSGVSKSCLISLLYLIVFSFFMSSCLDNKNADKEQKEADVEVVEVVEEESKKENDWKKGNLFGKVKSLRYTAYLAKDRFGVIEKQGVSGVPGKDGNFLWVFNQQGYVTEESNFNLDGSLKEKTIIKYDERGNKLELLEYNSEGELNVRQLYEIDERDNMIELRFNASGTSLDSVLVNKFIYDENDNEIERHRYYPNGSLFIKRIYKYDDKGNCIEAKGYNAEGDIVETYTYKYDQRNNLIEDIAEYKNDNTRGHRRVFKYDDNDVLIDRTYYKPDGSFHYRMVYEIDDKGINNESNQYDFAGNHLTKYTFEYELDEEGNWIKYIEFESGIPKYLTERVIEYF